MHKRVIKKSKKAITLVELIVSMALMSIFILACSTLILPVVSIYTHMNKQSRAQLLADTVVDSLRTECARTYISSNNDVWISDASGDAVFESFPESTLDKGNVLVIRKNYEYCETLSSNYDITGSLCNAVYQAEKTDEISPRTGDLTSRAIYNMFKFSVGEDGQVSLIAEDEKASPTGYLHYGFFKVGSDSDNGSYPSEFYDFTDPFMAPTYGDYTVGFEFHGIKYDYTDTIPVYVLVDVKIYDGTEIVYTRNDVVLRFASRVLE
jgi:type II secretory pathway pseudopilin PulG